MYVTGCCYGNGFQVEADQTGSLKFRTSDGEMIDFIPSEFTNSNCPTTSPLVIHLELTRRCHLKCKHCYISAFETREAELAAHEWIQILDELAELGTMSVYLTGGDPRLHPGFLEIVNHACDIGLNCNLLINGIGLTKKLIEQIPRQIYFVLSYDGTEGCRQLRALDGKVVMESARLLRDCDRKFALQGLLFHGNLDEMNDTIRMCADEDIEFQPIDVLPIGRARWYPELLLRHEDVATATSVDTVWRQHQARRQSTPPVEPVANPNVYRGVNELVRHTRRPEPGVFVAYVSSDGWLYPDNYYAAEGWGKAANLREVSFADAWQNSFTELRRMRIEDFADCASCIAQLKGACDLHNSAISTIIHNEPLRGGCYEVLKKVKLARAKIQRGK